MTVILNPKTGKYKSLDNFKVKSIKNHHKRARDKLSKEALKIKKIIDEESTKILQNKEVNKLLKQGLKALKNAYLQKNNEDKEDIDSSLDTNKATVSDATNNKVIEESKNITIKEEAISSEVAASIKGNLRGVSEELTATHEDTSSFNLMDMIGKVDQYIGEHFFGDLH